MIKIYRWLRDFIFQCGYPCNKVKYNVLCRRHRRDSDKDAKKFLAAFFKAQRSKGGVICAVSFLLLF